jgi:hypothetical protein
MLSEAKLKEVIFIGPRKQDLIRNKNFDKLLHGEGKAACNSFKSVVKGFLGNRIAQNYAELSNNILQNYQKLGCTMSL